MTRGDFSPAQTISVSVCAYDATGNVSTPVSAVQTTKSATGNLPPAPTGLSITADSPNQLTTRWTSGGGTTAGFYIAYGPGSIPPASCTSGAQVGTRTVITRSDFDPEQIISITVCAYDIDGNISSGISATQKTRSLSNIIEITDARIEKMVRYNDLAGRSILGDTFLTAECGNGILYTTTNDTGAWNNPKSPGHNVIFGAFDGSPESLPTFSGRTINDMAFLGGLAQVGSDGRTWKATALTCVDNILYLSISRYNEAGDASLGWMINASILKSTDFGRNWVNHLGGVNTAPPIAAGAMFPGSAFGLMEFVQYRANGIAPMTDRANEFIYAFSSNSKILDGDRLGRVRRADIGALNSSKWQFYQGGDGALDANWSSNFGTAAVLPGGPATALVTQSIVYLEATGRYAMTEWRGSPGGFQIFESEHLWGPWTKVREFGSDARFTSVPTRFLGGDGLSFWIFAASDYQKDFDYTLWLYKISLTQAPGGFVQPDPATSPGLLGQYYSDAKFQALRTTQVDNNINFPYGTTLPVPGQYYFSARWTGTIKTPTSEAYTLFATSDDKVRVWIDDVLVLDDWTSHAARESSSTPVNFVAGQPRAIRIDYVQETGGATLQLKMSSASQGKAIVPQSQFSSKR